MATVIALIAWGSASPGNLEGQATYYSPHLMETVAENRGMDLNGYLGGVALNRKGDLGRVVWLEFDRAINGPYLVVDCARKHHYETRERLGRVVEVDAETAKRQGFYRYKPIPVKVYFDDTVSCTVPACAR